MRPILHQIPNRFLPPVPRAARTIIALILREMATSYGRSPGGYVWAAAEPVAGIALLTFLFSMGFHAPPLGSSFALFYASGIVPFLVYVDISNKLSQAINFSSPLLTYPRVTLADAILARAFLNGVTQCLVVALVIIPLTMLIDTQGRVDSQFVILATFLALLLGFGVGAINCFLVTRFPVWQRVWSILNRPLFLLSCIVFTFDSIPAPYGDWLWYNPLIHIIGVMRKGLYPSYDAPYISLTFVIYTALILAVFGFFLIWRFKDQLLNR